MERVILHCDMNNFYASVECMLNPALRGKPVAVCGRVEDRHGIVLAKNYEAKKYGIETAETVGSALSKCRGLVIVPPHFERYLEYSRLARKIYSDYTGLIEPYGLDECWLDISGTRRLFGEPEGVAYEIKERIKNELGLTISVGMSFNKVFAKLGSDMKKPDAVTVIPYESFREKIWPLPACDMLGVGRHTYAKLKNYGIYTIGDLAGVKEEWIRTVLGKNGAVIHSFANGTDYSPVLDKDFVVPAKSIGHGTTAKRDIPDNKTAFAYLLSLAQDVGHRLSLQGKRACSVSVGIRSSQLNRESHQCALPIATQSPTILAENAARLLYDNYDWKYPIRSLSITAFDLMEYDEPYQLDLFSDTKRLLKTEAADRCIEKIRRRFGDGIIKNAVLLMDNCFPGEKQIATLPGPLR